MDKKTDKKNLGNIKDFQDFKLISRFSKRWSPLIIDFRREPGENWFIEAFIYKRKSGEISRHSLITNRDLPERERLGT